jgi:lambda family phage portal protein
LDDLKDYEESERIAARIGAAFALAITKSVDSSPLATSADAAFREMDIAPGIVADTLAPGEKIETIKNERPDNKLTDFRESQLRAVAGGTGTGYSNIAKDYEGSYSSQRQELVVEGRMGEVIRSEFVGVYVQPIYEMFINVAVLQGLLDISQVDPLTLLDASHVGLGTPYIEPKREGDADVLTIQAGIKSLTKVQLERGLNPREIQQQLIAERKSQGEAGLVLSSDMASAIPPATEAPPPTELPADAEDADDDDVDRYEVGRKYEGDDGLIYVRTINGFELDGNENVA